MVLPVTVREFTDSNVSNKVETFYEVLYGFAGITPYLPAGTILLINTANDNTFTRRGTREHKSLVTNSDRIKATSYSHFHVTASPRSFNNEYPATVLPIRSVNYNGTFYVVRVFYRHSGISPGFPFASTALLNITEFGVSEAPSVKSASDAKALQQLQRKKVVLSEHLIEIVKAGKKIERNAFKVLNAYRALRKRDMKGVVAALGLGGGGYKGQKPSANGLASAWLSYQYAWRPLIQDIYNSREVVKNLLEDRQGLYVRVKGVTIKTDASLPFNPLYEMTGSQSVGVESVYTFQVNDTSLSRLGSLGLLNPALIAWEALPLSFVVDWFAPVSTLLDSLSAPLGADQIDGYATTFATVSVTMTERTDLLNPQVGSLPSWKFSGSGFSREKNATPQPRLTFGTGITKGRFLNALSLAQVLSN